MSGALEEKTVTAQTHELIRRLYEWATDLQDPNFLDGLAEIIDCRRAAIVSLDASTGRFVVDASYGYGADFLSAVVQRHVDGGRYDPVLSPDLSGRFLNLTELVELARDPSASSAVPYPGADHPNIGIGVALNADRSPCLLMLEKDRAFDGRDRSVIETLLPHIGTAISARAQLLGAKKGYAALQQVVQRSRFGFLLFDGVGSELYRNDAADRILDADGCLTYDGESLIRMNGHGPAELDSKVHRHVKKAFAAGNCPVRLSVVNEQTGARCFVKLWQLDALIDGETLIGGTMTGAMIHDPDIKHVLGEDDIRALYGLTRAEARTCKLLYEGLNIETVSAQLGVTAHTTKAHLSHCFRKVGVHTQAALLTKLGFSSR